MRGDARKRSRRFRRFTQILENHGWTRLEKIGISAYDQSVGIGRPNVGEGDFDFLSVHDEDEGLAIAAESLDGGGAFEGFDVDGVAFGEVLGEGELALGQGRIGGQCSEVAGEVGGAVGEGFGGVVHFSDEVFDEFMYLSH